jgi:hypothetical protein
MSTPLSLAIVSKKANYTGYTRRRSEGSRKYLHLPRFNLRNVEDVRQDGKQ